jgi:hypothetical protein
LTAPDRVELNRPRDLNALLTDSFALYRRHFLTFIAIAFVVVVPVHAIVLGLGLGEFSGRYDSTPRPASTIVPVLVQVLVVAPLVSVMALHAVMEIGTGRRPRVGETIQAGLDAFARVFWPVLIAVLCEAATAITVVVPLVLLVRWYFVPQVVVMEKASGTKALLASWELTRGSGWRVAGLILVVNLLWALVGGLISTPLAELAKSIDSQAVSLAATTLSETLVAAPLGIFAALLYFDLRSRAGARAAR